MIDRIAQFAPGHLQLTQKSFSFCGQPIVFARRSLRGLYPFVTQQIIVLQTGEQRIERTFHHNEPRFLQFLYNILSISRLFMEQQHDTIFKHALAHLRLYIINVHNSYMLLNGLTIYNKKCHTCILCMAQIYVLS